jgi:hypothetical protein
VSCERRNAAAHLRGLTIGGRLEAPSTTHGLVELTAPAPAGGTPVAFTASHPDLVGVRGEVLVPVGEVWAGFTIVPFTLTEGQVSVLTATAADGSSARARIEIVPRKAALVERRPATDPVRNRRYVVHRGPEGVGVSMVDAMTLKSLTHRVLGSGVHGVAVDPAAGLVYVSHWTGRKVIVLRADDLSPVDEIGDGTFSGPLGMAVDPACKRIYVARTNRSFEPDVEALSVIQRHATGEHTVDRTIPLGPSVQPWDVALDVPAGLVYVLGLGDSGVPPQVIVLDRQSLDELGRVPVAGTPTAVTALPGTGIAHVAMDTSVLVVDGRRRAIAAHIPGPAATTVVAAE